MENLEVTITNILCEFYKKRSQLYTWEDAEGLDMQTAKEIIKLFKNE